MPVDALARWLKGGIIEFGAFRTVVALQVLPNLKSAGTKLRATSSRTCARQQERQNLLPVCVSTRINSAARVARVWAGLRPVLSALDHRRTEFDCVTRPRDGQRWRKRYALVDI